jgi:tight adherence protein B
MIASPVTMTAASALLAAAGLMVILSGRGPERRLRERVLETRDLKVTKPSGQEVLIEAPAKPNILLRGAGLLGYRSDLPAAYSASLRVVPMVCVAAGLLSFRLAAPVFNTLPAALVGLVAAAFAARFLFRRKSKAYTAALFRQIPDAMSLMLRAVRAGLPVAEAVRSVGRESMSPTREEFTRVSGEAALGMPIEIALQRLYHRTDIQEYAFFSVVIGLHGQTGGNLSETLENLADMVRRRVAMAAKAKALSAEGRLSAAMVGALPFVVGLLICVINPGYMNEFLTNPRGATCIIAFAVLLFAGLFTTHLLIQRSIED